MQVLVKSKTCKMQHHLRQSGHSKTKAIAGSQKEKKVEKKKEKEIDQASSLQSSPIEPICMDKKIIIPLRGDQNKGFKVVGDHQRQQASESAGINFQSVVVSTGANPCPPNIYLQLAFQSSLVDPPRKIIRL